MKYTLNTMAMVAFCGLVGCGSNPQTSSQNPTQKEGLSNIEATQEYKSPLPETAPVIKVVTTGNLPPFSSQDDFGNLQGYDIDAIRKVGEAEGFKVEFYKEAWQDLFSSVESGEYDLAASGISYKHDRNKKYGLSESYFYNPAAIMYLDDGKNINNLSDLHTLKVATLEGSKEAEQLKIAGLQANLSEYQTVFQGFEQLVRKNSDVLVYDKPLLDVLINDYPEMKFRVVAYESKDDPLAQQVFLVAKSNTELLNKVNSGVKKLKEDGTFEKLNQKWLGGK